TATHRALRHVVEAAWDLIPSVFDTGLDSTPAADAKKGAKIAELRGEIQKHLKEVDELTKKATDAYTEIIDDLDKGGQKYATNHIWLIHWQEDFTHDRERVPLVMAQASGDRDALAEALAKM